METAVSRLGCDIVDAKAGPYCFGDLSDSEREDFEVHLLGCDPCWREVRRLSEAVEALRNTPSVVNRVRMADVAGVLGMSGRLHEIFGGHGRFVLVTANLFGLLYTASLWTELGYSYDRFSVLLWLLSPLGFLGAGGAVATALEVDLRRTRAGQSAALGWSAGLLIGALSILTIAMWWALPHAPTIDATFQTRSAAAGHVKNVVLYFVPLLFFVLPTFHTIVALQRELRNGRHESVRQLLTGAPDAVPPRGCWPVPLWALAVVLGVGVLFGYQGINRMLDNLAPGPFAGLFSAALYLRVLLWYVVAVVAIVWYQRGLTELKREAVAVTRLWNSDQ